jgi:hypothetical protein
MAKVLAYHTDFEEHPAEYREVYHDHDDCPDGRLILPHHRSSGTGGKPQCKKCAELILRPVDEAIKRKILTLLEQHRIMTIATLRPDGWPQATTVGYANDGLTLNFLCGPDSQKAANLAREVAGRHVKARHGDLEVPAVASNHNRMPISYFPMMP